jgi:hypothetical protein
MPIDDDSFRMEPGLVGPRSRRQFLAALGALGLGAVAAACTKSQSEGGKSPAGSSVSPAAGSLKAIIDGHTQLSLFSGGGEPDTPLVPGKQLFGFALTTPQSQIVSGGSPQVYVSKDQTSPMSGPYPATWYLFKGYDATGDTSPRSPIAQGLYSARVDFPSPGNWYVAAVVQGSSGTAVGVGAVTVASSANNAPGTKATSVKTPVATSENGIKAICTSPVCHMHTISLDKALKNGKPTVVGFSTPALCESKLCGPVNDEQILVSEKYGKQANFIHVEEFLPGPDFKPPLPTAENQSPGFKAWQLTSEPWCFVIDRKGVITAALGPGPVVAPQIEEELKQVL